MTESQRKNAESQRKTPDREMVIRGLECIAQQAQNGTCGGCAYFRPFTDDPDYGWCDSVAIKNDALALLKKQEAVKPQLSISGMWYECPICHRHLTKDRDNYCARCGKAVKWDA